MEIISKNCRKNEKKTELTSHQEAKIDIYKKKWQQVAISTIPIDRQKVTHVIESIYDRIYGNYEFDIHFFTSPNEIANLIFLTQVYPNGNWENPRKLNHLIRQVEKDVLRTPCFNRPLDPKIQSPLIETVGMQFDLDLWNDLYCKLSFWYRVDFLIHAALRDRAKSSSIWQLAKPGQKKRLETLWDYLKFGLATPESLCSLCCVLDYCIGELNCSAPENLWQILTTFVSECGLTFFFRDFCLTCDRPCKVMLDERGLPHSENEAAIEFSDGFQIFAQHGVFTYSS